MTERRPGRTGVLRRVDEEWAALVDDDAARATCRRWAAESVVLADCAGPEDVLEAVARAPDAVLHHLLGRCAAGEPLAGRIVLQALLPKVVRMAAVDPVAGPEDYLTALWCRIATYPVDRRPTSVAANVALDTLKAVRRERPPRVDVVTSPEVVLLTADGLPGHVVGGRAAASGPTAVAVLDRVGQHRLVDAGTRELLRSVYAEGLSGETAAVRHGLTPAAVRVRCSRALKVLARHADLLAD